MGAESVVVQVEVLEWYVGGKEGDQGSLGVQTESVVVQVDRVQFGEV